MKELHLLYDEINFSVSAVLEHSQEDYVNLFIDKYFLDLEEVGRIEKLKEIYTLCLKVKADNQPKYEAATDEPIAENTALTNVNKRPRANARNSASKDGDATNTLQQ